VPYRCYGDHFQAVILLFVLGSCVSAADPSIEACSRAMDEVNHQYAFSNILWLDILFTAVFTVEMILKFIANGVLFSSRDRPWYVDVPYFHNWWNVMDFFFLVIMYLSFSYPQVTALRLLRILRPLRVVRRFRRLRLIVHGVVLSFPSIVATVAAGTFVVVLFAIVGVAAFKGKMYYCTVASIGDTIVTRKSECSGLSLSSEGVMFHASWEQYPTNFDDLPSAISYLIQISSLSSWTSLLSQATSVRGIDLQPVPKSNLLYSVYFVIFVLFANFFVTNIIVAVVVVALDEQRGFTYLTLKQRRHKAVNEAVADTGLIPAPPHTRFPRLQKFVQHKLFAIVLNVAVFFNIAVVASVHLHQEDGWTKAQFALNTTFTAIFALEAALKITAWGLYYFRDLWNDVDFAIVIGSLVELIIEVASSSNSVSLTSIGRSFRLLRVLRSVRSIPSVRGIFLSLAMCIPAIASVFAVLLLLLVMYSILGMSQFGHLKFRENINRDANFRSFWSSFIVVFRMFTLDSWNSIMQEIGFNGIDACSTQQSGWWYRSESGTPHTCGVLNDCGVETISQLYFFSFYLIGSYLFTNVIVAILLDNFRLTSLTSRSAVLLEDLDGYRRAWLRSHVIVGKKEHYEGTIPKPLLSFLCITLFNDDNGLVSSRTSSRLNIHPVLTSISRVNFQKVRIELNMITRERYGDLPDDQMEYHFTDVLRCLCRFQLGVEGLTLREREEREKTLFRIGATLLTPHMRGALQRRLELLRASHAVAEAAANAVTERFESEMGGAFGELYFSMRGGSAAPVDGDDDSPDDSVGNVHNSTRKQSLLSCSDTADYDALVESLLIVFDQLVQEWVSQCREVIAQQEADQRDMLFRRHCSERSQPKGKAALMSRWSTIGAGGSDETQSSRRVVVPLPRFPPTPAPTARFVHNPVLTLFSPNPSSPRRPPREVEEIEIVMDDDETIIELE
jgi:hypothetical protein